MGRDADCPFFSNSNVANGFYYTGSEQVQQQYRSQPGENVEEECRIDKNLGGGGIQMKIKKENRFLLFGWILEILSIC